MYNIWKSTSCYHADPVSSVSTQQMYGVVLRIEASLPTLDTRRTFFQDPLLVEDALCKFPVPSEYDFQLLDEIIRFRFKAGPGSRDVEMGNYELSKTRRSDQTVTASTRLLPGTAITMAILVSIRPLTDECCPMPKCLSDRTAPTSDGGRLWWVPPLQV